MFSLPLWCLQLNNFFTSRSGAKIPEPTGSQSGEAAQLEKTNERHRLSLRKLKFRLWTQFFEEGQFQISSTLSLFCLAIIISLLTCNMATLSLYHLVLGFLLSLSATPTLFSFLNPGGLPQPWTIKQRLMKLLESILRVVASHRIYRMQEYDTRKLTCVSTRGPLAKIHSVFTLHW